MQPSSSLITVGNLDKFSGFSETKAYYACHVLTAPGTFKKKLAGVILFLITECKHLYKYLYLFPYPNYFLSNKHLCVFESSLLSFRYPKFSLVYYIYYKGLVRTQKHEFLEMMQIRQIIVNGKRKAGP